jgi:BirA family transcriptional regulator, biotin operon repressor / biotin---[acetyl-CoA-carboxylase] ligase
MPTREFHDSIPSTQDRARELALAGASEGTHVVARVQTLGRGRLDHRWSSPPGGLYLSIVLRNSSPRVAWLPLLLGARVAEGLASVCECDFRVKWPNDVLAGSETSGFRKTAGILLDRWETAQGPVEIAGIGVNVCTPLADLPAELRHWATSLESVAPPAPSLEAVEAIVVAAALTASAELARGAAPAELRTFVENWLWGVGRSVTVDGVPSGTIVGLGEDGALLVRRGTETTPIRAGEVRVEEPG